MAIIDNYIIDGTLLSDHSSPATSKLSSALTTQSNTLNIRTTDLVNNLATLEFINEKVIVGQLMKRYNKGLIYTYVGDILISINPFQQLPDLYHVMVHINSITS
jgi:myosin heavy subunit